MMQWLQAKRLSEVHGDSFFIFDEDKFKSNFLNLSAAFNSFYSNTRIAYSYKTNYTPAICKIVNEMNGYAEVVSEMEYTLAVNLGVDYKKIIYNGPYKSFESIRIALISGSIVNLDSMRDYYNLLVVSVEFPEKIISVAVRCNFPIGNEQPSRFGFDVDGDEFRDIMNSIKLRKNIRLSGLHCHFPDRNLDSFGVRAQKILNLSSQLFNDPPDFLNLGGGFFSGMPDSLQKMYKMKLPSFYDYAKLIGEMFSDAFKGCRKLPILLIEPGTALVADTFMFYTKIISIKNIRGRLIATVAGSIFNISPSARSINLPVTILRQLSESVSESEDKFYDIAGFTCIEADYLTKELLGTMDVEDFLVYENVGSYSIVMKPPFILPNVPVLKKSSSDTAFTLIKHRETSDYIFQNFVS